MLSNGRVAIVAVDRDRFAVVVGVAIVDAVALFVDPVAEDLDGAGVALRVVVVAVGGRREAVEGIGGQMESARKEGNSGPTETSLPAPAGAGVWFPPSGVRSLVCTPPLKAFLSVQMFPRHETPISSSRQIGGGTATSHAPWKHRAPHSIIWQHSLSVVQGSPKRKQPVGWQ